MLDSIAISAETILQQSQIPTSTLSNNIIIEGESQENGKKEKEAKKKKKKKSKKEKEED